MADVFPPPRDVAVEEVAELLHLLGRQLRQQAHRELVPLGVTPAQARALRVLSRGGLLRMSTLADQLGIARRSATTVVDELAERGLVRRTEDPADRRAVTVDVTPAGLNLLQRLSEARAGALSDLAADLTPDELDQLRTLLRRLV
jgi:DNA-binding MarR family transcriptional regulator